MNETPELGDLIHNKTYKMNTTNCAFETTIEFVVGRYKFPFRFRDQTSSGVTLIKGEWIGTSILSFKDSVTAPPSKVGETTFSGEEGRYWHCQIWAPAQKESPGSEPQTTEGSKSTRKPLLVVILNI